MPPIIPLTAAEQAILQGVIDELTEDNVALNDALTELQGSEPGLQGEDDVLRKIHEGIGTGAFGTGSGLIPSWEHERKHQTGTFPGTVVTESAMQTSALNYTTPLFNPAPGPSPSQPWKLLAAPLPVPPTPTGANQNLFGGSATFAANERTRLDDEYNKIVELETEVPNELNRTPSNTDVQDFLNEIAPILTDIVAALDQELLALADTIAAGEITDQDPTTSAQLVTASDVTDAQTAETQAQTFKSQTQAWQANLALATPDLSDATLTARKAEIDARRTFIDGTRSGQILAVLNRLWGARYYWIGLRFNQRSGTFLNLSGNQGAQGNIQDQISENTAAIAAAQDILANQ